jgi:hypothetical protein
MIVTKLQHKGIKNSLSLDVVLTLLFEVSSEVAT